MKRPASIKAAGRPTGFATAFSTGMVSYFTQALARAQAVKLAGNNEPATFPTSVGYCQKEGVSPGTMRSWARAHTEMRAALITCAEIRNDIAELNLPCLVFDTEQL